MHFNTKFDFYYFDLFLNHLIILQFFLFISESSVLFLNLFAISSEAGLASNCIWKSQKFAIIWHFQCKVNINIVYFVIWCCIIVLMMVIFMAIMHWKSKLCIRNNVNENNDLKCKVWSFSVSEDTWSLRKISYLICHFFYTGKIFGE